MSRFSLNPRLSKRKAEVMSDQNSDQPTQIRRPWRATLRTVVATALAAIPLLPVLAEYLGLDTFPVVAAALAGTAGITRFLADPRTERFLRVHFPAIAADPNGTRSNDSDERKTPE